MTTQSTIALIDRMKSILSWQDAGEADRQAILLGLDGLTREDKDVRSPKTGDTVLSAVLDFRDQNLLEHVIRFDCDPCAPDNKGRTPLMKAVIDGNQEAVKLLMSSNRLVSTGDGERYPDKKYEKLMQQRDSNGKTAYEYSEDNPEMRKLLVNIAFWEEFQRSNLEEAEKYIKLGANIAHSYLGPRPLTELACAGGNIKALELLLKHGAKISTAEEEASAMQGATLLAHARTPQMVAYLCEHGANPRAECDENYPVIIAAVTNNMLNDAKPIELIRQGADINASTEGGVTLLMLATQWGMVDLIRELVRRKVNVHAADDDGKTALDYIDKRMSVAGEIEGLLQGTIEIPSAEGAEDWRTKVPRRGGDAVAAVLANPPESSGQALVASGPKISRR